jgi:NAD(P)-dependent dehydrogenase (short-subunit alcohol dehydrogenase family)
MLLENRVALVTGSANGMGRGIAHRFADEGCDLVINDLDEAGCERVAGEIRAKGRRALAAKADITRGDEIEAMTEAAIREFGKIDILVNNAGGVPGTAGRGNSDNITEAEWDRVVDLNLKGPFLVTMSVLPHMKKSGYGKILFVSSMGAVSPCVSVLHYHTAKAGVLGLATNLAFELAPQRIFVNAIVPGPVDTTFWDALVPAGPEREALFDAIAKKEVPLERVGRPDDIAGPALFLASGLSDYVTGQVVYAAGGQPLLAHGATFNIEAFLMNRMKK